MQEVRMSKQFEELVGLLKELFQLDQPDLDFGLYRIMHAKADEISQFLDRDLLPQVQDALSQYQTADRIELEEQLKELVAGIEKAGMDPDKSPKVKELEQQIADHSVDVTALENEVYGHLFSFFRRYYHEGDFLSKRVYKPGVYAIPYEGEELKLHWANRDQYYIKTSEFLRDYAFTLRPGDVKDPMRVHFRLAEAMEGEHGNVRAAESNDRVFVLAKGDYVTEEEHELIIRFHYRPAVMSDWSKDALAGATAAAKKKPPVQSVLLFEAVKRVLSVRGPELQRWVDELARPHIKANGEQADYNRLQGHLNRYTARNTFDYFIHKDLGEFLRRELDFFIKNEIMHLDDIESESAPRVEQYLSKIKIVRRIANKLINFLSQLEDFQRKLWLKKRFVVQTTYCMTLDRVPEEFYPQVASCEDQRKMWVSLFSIADLDGYSEPLTVEFLKSHPKLIVDTALFDEPFSDELISAQENLEQGITGIMVHADNFHALNLAQKRFGGVFKSIYIDPPYNTDSSSIPYKNNYRHSSFATMIRDRIAACYSLMSDDGAIFVSIDKTERTVLEHALNEVFGANNRIEELIWTQATANSQLPNYSTNHEYVEVYARDRASVEADKAMFREPKPGFSEVMDLVGRLGPEYPPLSEVEAGLKELYRKHKEEYQTGVVANGRKWNADAKRRDPWRGLYPYNRAEYRSDDGSYVSEKEAQSRKARIWVWREMPTGAPAAKQSSTTRDPEHPNYRYYKPIHPVTKRPCPHPQSGWKFPLEPDKRDDDRRSFVDLDADHRVAWGDDEAKIPQTKGFLHEVETNIGTSVFYEYNDGEAELNNMFNQTGLFLSPKSSKFVKRFILQSTKKDSWFSDFFCGSGSSAHGVIQANREDGGQRKFFIVEMGHYFEWLTKPRILKALYASDWKAGVPRSNDGKSALLKVIRLESYEDALNNLVLEGDPIQRFLLEMSEAKGSDGLREQYVLRYMLDVEARGSHSLLNVDAFSNPVAYRLAVKLPGGDETREINVDLLETFNYLIGLTVNHIAAPQMFDAAFNRDADGRLRLERGILQDDDGRWWFRTVDGVTPEGRKTLVIWRKLTGDAEQDNLVLDEWFAHSGYLTQDYEFSLIYVNGDNNLENLRQPGETWKVRLIEEDFHRLMFDVEDL